MVMDLLPRVLCQFCSNDHQRPVRHKVQDCPRKIQDPLDVTMFATPDPDRCWGEQHGRKYLAALRKAGKRIVKEKDPGPFPCPFPRCPNNHYKTASGCNKHIKDRHGPEALVLLLVIYFLFVVD